MNSFTYNYSDKKCINCIKQVYNNQIGHIFEEKMNNLKK